MGKNINKCHTLIHCLTKGIKSCLNSTLNCIKCLTEASIFFIKAFIGLILASLILLSLMTLLGYIYYHTIPELLLFHMEIYDESGKTTVYNEIKNPKNTLELLINCMTFGIVHTFFILIVCIIFILIGFSIYGCYEYFIYKYQQSEKDLWTFYHKD